jgi:hypothetical protein
LIRNLLKIKIKRSAEPAMGGTGDFDKYRSLEDLELKLTPRCLPAALIVNSTIAR